MGFLGSRLRRHKPPRPGVMQPVGQFHYEHPNVFRHGDNHFPHRFRLRRIAVFHPVQFGDTVNQHGHFVAKFSSKIFQ